MKKFIELTHNHFGHKISIAVDKVTSVQRKYNPNTGEARTLVTYGESGGNYVREEPAEVMGMMGAEVVNVDSLWNKEGAGTDERSNN